MRFNQLKSKLNMAVLAVTILLLGASTSFAQVVNLTAQPGNAVLPDGQTVPMWGYVCNDAGTTAASCAAINTHPGSSTWSPVLITVQATSSATPLTINLTNALPTAVLETSLVIVGQLGDQLGTTATSDLSPAHGAQSATWPIVGDPTGPQFTPPPQGNRVRSFVKPATHGTAASLTWSNLKPGTYLIESGTYPSIQGPMGLYGVLVVTAAPVTAVPPATTGTQGTAYPGVLYDAEVPLVLSEIDPVQNAAVALAVATPGFTETAVWAGQPAGACGTAAVHSCYPPAVNYDPRYYLVNGVSLDKALRTSSLFAATPASAASGTVLVRFVNAGLRMHVPSIVGAQTGAVNATTGAASAGFSLIAEDGNVLPGTPRIQSEVFLAAGKTYDVMINMPAAATAALPVFDRQLSLSTNNHRDGGMTAYIGANGATLTDTVAGAAAVGAVNDNYFMVPVGGNSLTVRDPAKGVIANDVGISGVTVLAPPAGTLALNADGTFTFSGSAPDSFTYCANGTVTSGVCSSGLTATVTIAVCSTGCLATGPTVGDHTYTSNIANRIQISPPGVLEFADGKGMPISAGPVAGVFGGTVTLNADGSFIATAATPGSPVSFTYTAVNSQGTASSNVGHITVNFLSPSGLKVSVVDAPSTLPGKTPISITDYRWIIEEDRSFVIDPNATPQPVCMSPGVPTGCSSTGAPVATLGTNFHTSYMPLVAAGCVGTVACEDGQKLGGMPAVCDIGNGKCRTDAAQQVPVDPGMVHLDSNKRYYISILPGDAGNDFINGGGAPVPVNPADPNGPQRPFDIAKDCPTPADFAPGSGTCGHGMGGAPIKENQTAVTVKLEETPFQTAKIAVFVFQDDSPLNGENDTLTLGTVEGGLGGFEIRLFDAAGGTGDSTGQMTYDMFNYPLSNSLAGTKDPQHPGNDACPITSNPDGLIGMIVTCPHFESDGVTISPLEGQAVIANMMPGRYSVQATEGADRIARGEEWLQTNTLDGQKAHDAFIKAGGPAYFQEFGPAGYHVLVGFANPAIINARHAAVCKGVIGGCPNNTVKGFVSTARMSRTPDQRLFGSGTHDSFGFTQCYASLGDPSGADFAFTKCDQDGHFAFTGIPAGDWRITFFDQWNDQIMDGLSTPVRVSGDTDLGEVMLQQWHTNIYTRSFIDANGDGVSQDSEPGLTLLPTNIRFRDGSYSNFNNTDLAGFAGFNEIFPLFNWYVIEADTTRYKQTGVHVVYDAGGPADTPFPVDAQGNQLPCPAGKHCSNTGGALANTTETNHLPAALRIPGSVYCNNADCSGFSFQQGPSSSADPAQTSTGRIDPPSVTTEAWQGYIGENQFVEFGKKPFNTGENGGIHGEVIYASTRPFDDPALLIHTSWTPDVPNVIINLYREGTATDGTTSLKLVDTTKTTSWDDFAQGFRNDGSGVPNMNCPGQDPNSLFFFTLQNSPMHLSPGILPANSQYKCYDGFAQFNQVQPAPYDGYYHFPSVTATDPVTGVPTATNCTGCIANPSSASSKDPTYDPFYAGTPMLPAGKYVVEMIVPPGYELVKEEDKNILIGDNYIAPVTQQFGGLGSVFILPDQAAIGASYNPNNPTQPTTDLGSVVLPRHEGDTGSVESFWPCVGLSRIVPDFISLFPQSKEVAPFAGSTRNLCDRKEVTLEDQTAPLAKFWVFSSTHVAAHFTGIILDDFSSEFDPFSPQFGEKFAVPNVPISFKDYNGVEVLRTYSDQWGLFNGMNYSTWEVNPPNPTGYAPTMMVTCMNDPGPIPGPGGTMIQDPLYNPAYSQFCYDIPFMPGQTQYMDTPVVPTAAFADGYNLPDCAYPDTTPAVSEVDGDGGVGKGPWVAQAGNTLTITSLGDQVVRNHAYAGPSAKAAPFNQKFITRHYGFGTTSGTVTIGGIPASLAPGTNWDDKTLTVTVPTIPAANSTCPIQQRGASPSTCGELVITAANGRKSVDAVTVTIGGKTPTYVPTENATNNVIQKAIDAAAPGDLLMLQPGVYNEMLIMWKPVRLQGVGAASVTVNANAHPSGKIDPWRRQVACLFGLSLNGGLISGNNPFDPNGTFTCSAAASTQGPAMQGQVDPLPLESLIGWDPTLNGNIAELLQEPTLMGAYEGAAITVLAKGVRSPDANCTTNGVCIPLTASNRDCNAWPSNFKCNPSRIDGITFTNSSQGGGGIFLHGWDHSTEVSNNRVYANAGTLTGGITVGQQETAEAIIAGTQQVAFAYNTNVNVHNNYVTENSSTTPIGAGGVTMCTGSDNYKFNYNWVCGNMTSGDGGGLTHFGFSNNGTIANNTIIFNQSSNPTIPTHGGGVAVIGGPPDGPACEKVVVDGDCPPGLTDGVGRNLVIDSNLILGNTAESGSGGGLRLESVNGGDVARNPRDSSNWYDVTVINNIIANNVAGWDGGGVSLSDALKVRFINNTVMSNDSTASAGVLMNTIAAPAGGGVTESKPLPAGLVSLQNTAALMASLPVNVSCPFEQPNCNKFSNPLLLNNLFWQNRSFHIHVGGVGAAPQEQQNVVTLEPALNQAKTGACTIASTNNTGNVNYWEIGVRGDTSQTGGSGFRLNPRYSILTDSTDYAGSGTNNLGADPNVVAQYCNGSRVPPENGGLGYAVPPGVSDATLPNPIFNLTASATVDEGNNWVNMSYGPLSLVDNSHATTANTNLPALGNYAITATSPAINKASPQGAPDHDFFGTPRLTASKPIPDIGAVEAAATGVPVLTLTPTSLVFGNHLVGTSTTLTATLSNTGGAPASVSYSALTNFARNGGAGSCGTTLAQAATCTISITFAPSRTQATLTAAYSDTLTLSFASPATPATLTLSLSGTGFRLFDPAALAFGNQQRGTSSAAKSVTLSNQGTTALTITNIAVGGNGANQFTGLNFSSCGTLPITLASGATCTVSVQFRPIVNGASAANLNFSVTGVAGGALPVALSGTGIAPSGTLTPNPVPDFGSVKRGSLSAPQTVTFQNTGAASITIGAITTSTAQFGIVAGGTCSAGGAVPAGGTCTVSVRFKPTAGTGTGPKTANLQVAFPNGGGGGGNITVTDALSGTATN